MEQRYNELSNKLSEPDIANDKKQFAELMKEFKNLSPIIEKYKKYQSAENCRSEDKDKPNPVTKKRQRYWG